jgi:hypothetical protein
MKQNQQTQVLIREWLDRAVKLLKVHAFLIFAIVSFIAITAYYMGPSVTRCTDTVYGYGDNTSGPIWKYGLPGAQSPLGHFENYTNYPYGENLYSPVNYSGLLQSTTLWAFAKVAGPVCGYNLVNFFGFVSAALVMCGFVYWLLRRRWIAWLSGFVVSFAPYFQYKVGGHPSYGYQALLIGALWLAFKVLRDRKKLDAVFLGVITGACFYWDPYFSLLIFMTLAPVAAAWAGYSWLHLRSARAAQKPKATNVFKGQLRALILTAVAAGVLLVPLVGVRLFSASQITSYVSGARGDILFDAIHCSNLPEDYLLPSDDNWFVGKFLSPKVSDEIRKFHHGCNPSEYTTGIAWVVTGITSLGLVVFAWEKLNKRKLFKVRPPIDLKFVVVALVVMVVAAAILALPPALGKFKFPSWYLLHFIDIWRILARLYIVVNIGVTTLFAVVLYYFSTLGWMKERWKRWAAIAVLFAFIFVQYQPFAPLHGSRATFSYTKDLSSIYYWLRDQKDINFIAAYPMTKVGEAESIAHYITYQHIHGKHLLNSTLPNSPQERMRYSIKDLSDPQTLPILRYLGVDALEIHGLTPEEIEHVPGLKVLRYDDYHSGITGGKVAIVKLEDGPKLDYALVLEQGYPTNALIMRTAEDVEFETQQGATMDVKGVLADDKTKTAKVCFAIKTADPLDHDQLTASIDGKPVLGPIAINGTYTPVTFMAQEDQVITLHNETGHNMRIDALGCQQ